MVTRKFLAAAITVTMGMSGNLVYASDLTVPHTFSAGTPAVAAEVNENFTAVETAVDDNHTQISDILNTISALQNRIDTLEKSNADLVTENEALETRLAAIEDDTTLDNFTTTVLPYMTGGVDAQGEPAVFFSAVNVHINNGEGYTESVNGTGNLIIGYDENISITGSSFCTLFDFTNNTPYTNQLDCENAGGSWGSTSQKLGSHNIAIGQGHSYTQYGGLLAGSNNIVAAPNASISGGSRNLAPGYYSSISGGFSSLALGYASSVSGGADNTASDTYGSVSGGYFNVASGLSSSVSGGYFNVASGSYSSVSGGSSSEASGGYSSVSGGDDNTASGLASSVSGGNDREASGTYDWVAGSLFENN